MSQYYCMHCVRFHPYPGCVSIQDSAPNNLDNQGMKHDTQKNRVELLSPVALEKISQVLTFGAKKYDSWNWSKGIIYTRLLGATLRHLFAYLKGEDKDPESGLSHLAHAGCCIMFLLHFEEIRPDLDDREKNAYNKKA